MRLNHNLASLNICREHNKVLERQSMVMNRISSGFKINSAKESPSGIATSEKMRVQIRGLQIAQKNAQDGISMLQATDGTLDTINSMLIRVRELTIQAGGASSEDDKKALQGEINQMLEGIDSAIKNSDFNGKNLLVKKDSSKDHEIMAIGSNVGETVDIPIYDLSSKLNLSKLKVDTINDFDNIGKNLDIIDKATDEMLQVRSKYGALCNRFEGTYNEVNEMHDTIVETESKIRDTDVAEAMVDLARDNILIEAGQAMLVQSNKFPQDALRVLENIK